MMDGTFAVRVDNPAEVSSLQQAASSTGSATAARLAASLAKLGRRGRGGRWTGLSQDVVQ